MSNARKQTIQSADEWEPPERDIAAVAYFGVERAWLQIENKPETAIQATEMVNLTDMC